MLLVLLQVKCLQCQHESNRYENMMDLAVEIHGFVESLEDAIAQFTAPEMLDGENKYKCDRCVHHILPIVFLYLVEYIKLKHLLKVLSAVAQHVTRSFHYE